MHKRIIVMAKGQQLEAWGSLRKICDAHGFNYNTLKNYSYPFVYRGWVFHRVLFNQPSQPIQPGEGK